MTGWRLGWLVMPPAMTHHMGKLIEFNTSCAPVYVQRAGLAGMAMAGAGPGRSAFLSAFFTLVGLHGAHVAIGLLWLGTMMAQLWAKGFRPDILRRGLCFGLFWHALDIIWIGIFTNVYLLGTSP